MPCSSLLVLPSQAGTDGWKHELYVFPYIPTYVCAQAGFVELTFSTRYLTGGVFSVRVELHSDLESINFLVILLFPIRGEFITIIRSFGLPVRFLHAVLVEFTFARSFRILQDSLFSMPAALSHTQTYSL